MDSIHNILTTLEQPVRFYFVRHGESEGNVEGKMQGHKDRHLTDLGRSQAEGTARWFAETKIHVDHVYTSPLIRARETAEILATGAGYPPPEPLDSVLELHTGVFTDYSFPEIQEKFPAEYAEFVVGSWESVPEAESIASLTRRGLDTWEELVRCANATTRPRAGENGESAASGSGAPSDAPATVLTVTHGGMLQWILKVSFGATVATPVPWMPLILASNCSVFSFTARPVQSTDRTGKPLRWYYGQWSMMNFTPAEESSPGAVAREQFHTAGDQAR